MKTHEQFKACLEVDRVRLQTDLEAVALFDETTGDWVALPVVEELGQADENLEADAVESWNERRATVSQLETSFKNVTRALEKIAAGNFGTCEISGLPIEADRLDANPSARTCKAHRNDERELSL